MRVMVESIVKREGTIWVAQGRTEDTSLPVLFAGDWRPMSVIADAIVAGEGPIAEVEAWQVLAMLAKPEDGDVEQEVESRCPACGDFMSYCQGHGEIGDPAGHAILVNHDLGAHEFCHPEGCDEAAR